MIDLAGSERASQTKVGLIMIGFFFLNSAFIKITLGDNLFLGVVQT